MMMYHPHTSYLSTNEIYHPHTSYLSTNDDIPSSYILLTNKQINNLLTILCIRKFVADVMGDDLLQQEGGNALMKSVTYALQPGLIRITGFTLAVASIALAKIVLSPY